MARVGEVLLDIDIADAEGGGGDRLRRTRAPSQVGLAVGHRHADAAAAAGGLDDDGVADLRGDRLSPSGLVTHSSLPGTTGTPALFISARAATLLPMSASTWLDGPMNLMPCLLAGSEAGVLGKEAVAGVDGLGAALRPCR